MTIRTFEVVEKVIRTNWTWFLQMLMGTLENECKPGTRSESTAIGQPCGMFIKAGQKTCVLLHLMHIPPAIGVRRWEKENVWHF
jgi:hypothetical protein